MKMKIMLSAKFNICCFLFFITCIQLSGQSWERTYGGLNMEEGSAVQQTSDGGFIVVGSTTSFGAGSYDTYFIKTDVNGNTMWTKTAGGFSTDKGHSVQQTYDGGYMIAGETGTLGNYDFYLVKTDANGIVTWTKIIGTGVPESCNAAIQTSDSGYCMVGTKGSWGSANVWLVKTNSNGDTTWTRTYGVSILEAGYSLQQTVDGGFIIAGSTYNIFEGHYDAYLIKTDNNGDTLWTRIFNEGHYAYGHSVSLTSDSGYIVGGTSGENFYAVKLDATGTVQWTKEIDKGGGDRCLSVIQSIDGGYIMAGYTYASNDADVLIIKLDQLGNEVWSKRYVGNQWEEGWMIRPVSNGGFIIVGNKDYDIYLIKTACDHFPSVNIAVLDTFCQGNTLAATLFTNTQMGATYQWTKNDTNLVGAVLPNFIAFAEGNYTLTITDSVGCSNVSNSIYINFPEPYFYPYPRKVCPGDNVIMGNWNWSQQTYSSYDWDFGDGTTDTGVTTTHAYQDTGVYIITRTVRTANGSCNSYLDSVTISTTAVPPVDFDILVNSRNMLNNIACPGDRIEFIPYAYTYLFVPLPPFEAASYLWNFGDGTTDTIPFPVHYYTQTGNYTITLIVTNHCGNSNSASATIVIDNTLSAYAYFNWTDAQGIYNDTVNACEQISFYANSSLIHHWNFGDGTSWSTTSDTIRHAYTLPGNYSVQLITTNGCGNSDTLNRIITVDGACTSIHSPPAIQENVLIYPNPFFDHATLQITPSVKNASLKLYDLRIFDLQGREVKHLTVDKLMYTINREKLTGGMYFYKLSSGNENIATGKFIVQ